MADLTQVRRSIVRPTALFGQTNYHKKKYMMRGINIYNVFRRIRKITKSDY